MTSNFLSFPVKEQLLNSLSSCSLCMIPRISHPSSSHFFSMTQLSLSQVYDERRTHETSSNSCAILKITTRGKQNPSIHVRRVERLWNAWARRPQSGQEGLKRLASRSCPSTLHTYKCTLLALHSNHMITVYAASLSRHTLLSIKYGKVQWFTNLAANSNYLESSIKSQREGPVPIKSESPGLGDRINTF